MKNKKSCLFGEKIIRVCIWLLPFALIGVMFLVKQSSSDYETIRKYFIFIGFGMAVVGLFLRLATDNFYGHFLVYGGVIVLSGTSLLLGGGQTTEPVPVEPIQAVTVSEGTRSFILSFATAEQVHRFGIVLAVITGALFLYFAVKFILSIKWEDLFGMQQYLPVSLGFGMLLAIAIYVLSIV